MSEQRFDIIYDCQGVTRLIDRENKLISLDFGFDWNDLDDYEKDKVREWLDLLNTQQATINKQEEIIKSQDMEISRQYNLCLAMSGVLREEFGVYDVFDRTKDRKVE